MLGECWRHAWLRREVEAFAIVDRQKSERGHNAAKSGLMAVEPAPAAPRNGLHLPDLSCHQMQVERETD